MKIAAISDIHGNHYALEKVLEVAKKEGCDKILALGDFVGYYYHPEIVLDLLSKWSVEAIKGNHEILLHDLYEERINSTLIKEKYGSGHEQALKNLDSSSLNWLFSLPMQTSIELDNVSFQLNHGTPWSIDEYLYPDSDKEKLERCNSISHDFVLVGHSHYSFSRRCKDSTLVNCGSVGQSRQNGGLASWVLFNTDNKTYQSRATPYDTSELLKEVQLLDSEFKYSSKILSR
ncbi:metallophosphoesterase [Pedobacter foliorum]|uniref:metallophosphoesterase family protein n=1 Tax=Pedobacter foliorum TaxID=2739058 RepID=UPI0015679E13|nr:metallophosphoesterase family protein [Pedobacter foliorum]NRF39194.1 metallophosphoesterase family protein [Pedobacter foliorum]